MICVFFFKDAETKELDESVELNNSKTLCATVGRHLIRMAVAYLDVLILKALSNKVATNINVF